MLKGRVIDSAAVSSPATETFTVSGGDKVADGVSAAGSGLVFTLQTSGGTTLAAGTGSASAYPGWQTYLFPPTTLKNGQAYNLVNGSVYRAVQRVDNYGMCILRFRTAVIRATARTTFSSISP